MEQILLELLNRLEVIGQRDESLYDTKAGNVTRLY